MEKAKRESSKTHKKLCLIDSLHKFSEIAVWSEHLADHLTDHLTAEHL